ncbi:MAG: ATP-binding protein [Oscillospiraceae bacterium]|nr:ATP-binding protein [Oscillospiraceae bacterium]
MKIPKRMAGAVIHALQGGVVPRIGLQYIAVGREKEIEALLNDIEVMADGGASFRFISGKYGSGKSFLLQTIRSYAMDRGFAVCDADLSPERRLSGSNGQGLATYKELMQNLSTKTKPDGGALTLILDKWINGIRSVVAAESGLELTDPAFHKQVEKKIYHVIDSLSTLVHGFDFATILKLYYQAFINDDMALKACVIKWFRGEYQTKTEARNDLGVSICIRDDDWYEYIKLFAMFLKQAGYQGLIVLVDELVNLYKIPQSITREKNYEKILTIYNDAMQGKARYMGIVMCGTPQCMEDPRRGIFSYEALRSRLTDGKYCDGKNNMNAPIIRLEPLRYAEMRILVEKLAEIHSVLYDYPQRVTAEDMDRFIQIEYGRIGADSQLTPREVIRDFIEVLDIMQQHPTSTVDGLLSGDSGFSYAPTQLEAQETVAEEYAEFTV